MLLVAQAYSARWLLAAIGIVLYIVFKYRASKRLAAFQGPFSTSWSEIWHTRAILSLQSHLNYKAVNDKYGAFLQIRRNRSSCGCSPRLTFDLGEVRSGC
jgi:hypothetical protein